MVSFSKHILVKLLDMKNWLFRTKQITAIGQYDLVYFDVLLCVFTFSNWKLKYKISYSASNFSILYVNNECVVFVLMLSYIDQTFQLSHSHYFANGKLPYVGHFACSCVQYMHMIWYVSAGIFTCSIIIR